MSILRRYRHVSILPDGNGRWARQRGHPRVFGHQAGAANFIGLLPELAKLPIDILSIYLFSTENLGRPKAEVNIIFQVVEKGIEHGLPIFMANDICVKHIGERTGLPVSLQRALSSICHATRNNRGLTLVIAINYGGRGELIRAIRCILQQGIPPEVVDAHLIDQHLYLPDLPDPDIVLRTGGEYRLSNWMTWQTAHSLVRVLPVLWPDLTLDMLNTALWKTDAPAFEVKNQN